MSLLKKPELNTRWKKLLLVAVALLLLVPCVAAAAFAVRFEVDPYVQDSVAQDQERKEKEKEKEKEKLEMKVREGRTMEELKERALNAEDQLVRESIRREVLELEARAVMHAALVQLAKINMDQAIQIASSQQPGKVLMCSLGAKGWEAPGKLGKDGSVFYHVIIANEANASESTHVWVNAIDGTIMKTEKELPRKMRSPEGN